MQHIDLQYYEINKRFVSQQIINIQMNIRIILAFILVLTPLLLLKNSSFSLARQQLQQLLDLPLNAQTTYSSNMTKQQLDLLSNAVAASQRKYNVTQLNESANYISVNLQTITNNPWIVFVFQNKTQAIGIGATGYENKSAVIIKAGKYQLSYVFIQRRSSQCSPMNTVLSNNETYSYTRFGLSLTGTQVQRLKAAAQSSTTYAGNNITKAAKYIQDKVSTSQRQTWNAIIFTPTIRNGAWFCPYISDWGAMIKYGDLNWSFYIFKVG